ncbi:hypothetical protein NCCP2331_11390 [Sporosarcina sp. NCCP-2331]|nr:hypothetical protein NCCP2331_11390 [Sporosarcina sp. NCCP-2331]GLB56621.1 hypothetical protein NCCP2378_24080 [Sporosarcina sp. NCCP-2378]
MMAVYVFIDCQFMSAASAKHRFFIELLNWPDSMISTARFFMTIITGIVGFAAVKLDCYAICLRMKMYTSSFFIYQ